MEDALKLKLNALPFGTHELTCHVDEGFFNRIGQTDVRRAAVDVQLRVTRMAEADYRLEIACDGFLTIPCDRCLDDMEHAVHATYSTGVRQQGEEFDDSTDGLLLVPASWHELDAAPLVRDTVLLTLPLTHSHADESECNSDMLALLSDHTAADFERKDDEAGVDPRWAALAKLKEGQK